MRRRRWAGAVLSRRGAFRARHDEAMRQTRTAAAVTVRLPFSSVPHRQLEVVVNKGARTLLWPLVASTIKFPRRTKKCHSLSQTHKTHANKDAYANNLTSLCLLFHTFHITTRSPSNGQKAAVQLQVHECVGLRVQRAPHYDSFSRALSLSRSVLGTW